MRVLAGLLAIGVPDAENRLMPDNCFGRHGE
jgi:hypothetical protein